MTQVQSPAMQRLVVAHLALAMVPVLMGLVSIDMRTLPLVWSLASNPLAQVMLLAIWTGLAAEGTIFRKTFILLAAGAYLAIGTSLGQVFMSEQPSLSAFGAAYAENVSVFWVLLALLSLVLAGLSRTLGRIRIVDQAGPPTGEPRYRFSLLAMLAASTAIALALALSRLARMQSELQPARTTAVDYALGVAILSLNMLVMIWATLGPAHVKRRLVIVLCIAFLLGSLLAVGAGNSLDTEPWWFLWQTLVVLVPTMIAIASLLYLRRHGFRLIPPTTQSPLPPQTA